jgi:hypothetical protein
MGPVFEIPENLPDKVDWGELSLGGPPGGDGKKPG